MKKNVLLKYLVNSLIIFAMTTLCSLFGLVFLADTITNSIQVIMGIIFVLAVLTMVFSHGKSCGDKDYKKTILEQTGRSNSTASYKLDIIKCLSNIVLFFGIMFVLVLVGVLFKLDVIFGIVTMLFMPTVLIFSSVIIADTISIVTLGIFLPYLFMVCGSFIAGYLFKIMQIKKTHRDIANELRMFNN